LRGGILTITNCNWTNGNMNADANGDKTIIPIGGVLNFPTANARYLSYNTAAYGRGLDIFGTMNWSGDSQLVGVGAQTVNNYGAVNVTGTGIAQFTYASGYPAPTWNNFGTFTKSGGTNIFYFQGCYLNNTNVINFLSGSLNPYATTFTNLGSVSLAANALFQNDNGSVTYLQPGSSFAAASANALRIPSGTVYLRTPDVTTPAILISGGTLQQETNCAVTTINENTGTWLPTVPVNFNTYNLTNGDLRGADVTLANFNWLGGNLYSSTGGGTNVTVNTSLNISGGTTKNISYLVAQPSRTLINNGVGNWSGASISGSGSATIRNNNSLTLSNDVALAWSGSGVTPFLINNGSLTKISGNGSSAFGSCTFTNSGTLNFTNGSFSSGDFYQTTGSTHLGTNFTVSGNVRVNGGTFTGRGGATGIFYNNGTLNPGASPGFISTAHYTNTFAATVNLELAGTNAPGTNYDQLRFTGTAVFDGNLNVSLANSFAPLLGNSFTAAVFTARSGTFANIIPPPGVGLTATYSTTNLVLNISTLTNVPLQITSFPTNVGVWTPDGAAFSIGVSGTTPISYQWQFNGTNISGATNVTYALASSVVSNAGIYNVVVTDGASATTNASATLAVTQFTGLITWTNVAGGSWNVPTNWVPARVPNATNTAIITNAGSYTVTVDADAAVSNLLVGLNGAPVTNQLTVYPASLTVGSNATFATNATLYLASTFVNSNLVVVDGKFYFDAGALAGNGRWLLGTNSITTLRTGGYKYLNSGFVENFGAFNFDGTEYRGLAFANNVTFTNQPGGNISLGYSGFSAQSGATNNPLVNRSLITAPGNPSSLGAPFLNETNGTLAVTSSCYVYTGTNRGTLEVLAPLATLAFVSGNFNLETGSQLRGLGTIGANFYGVLNFNTPIICSNQINAYGATASPVININAHLTNRYTVSVSKGDFNVAPGITLDAASINVAWQYQTYTHSTFNNGGTVIADTLAQSYGSLVNSNQLFVRSNFNFSGGSFINNSAANKLTTLSNCVSTITTASYSVGKSFNGGLWENFGTVNFDAPALNSLYFAGGAGWINRSNAVINAGSDALVVNYDGTNWLANYGLIQRGGAASAPALTLVTTNYNQVSFLNTLIGLGDYTQLSGQTDLGGSEIRGGQLKILGGEIIGATSLTSGATLYNAATLRPGSTIGAMSVSDSFTNTASGVFHMEIAGNSPSQYDTVFVGGPVKLDGTLNLILTNGFIPTVGHSYTAMTYTVRSGQFANVVMPGYDFEVIYLTNALILKSSNALPVVTFSVASGNSTQLVCNPFRVTASATDLDGVVTNLTVRLDTTTIANTTGGAINATSEIDFPSTVNFIATAIDDHAGSRSVTQALQLVTLPLHQLTLGGKRTNDFKICMLGQPGSNYILYATTNVQTPFINWSNLGVMENTNGIWRYRDASTITNRPFRYYKAKQQ
jgi:hypothetical protein